MRITELLIDICGADTCEETGLVAQLENLFSKLPIHNLQPGQAPPPLEAGQDYTNDQLADMLMAFTAWAQFWCQEHSTASVSYALAKSRLDQEVIRRRNIYREQIEEAKTSGVKPPMAKGDINDEVRDSELVRGMQHEVTCLSALRETMEAQQRTYDKYGAAVSRVVEIRKMEVENNLREGRAQVKRTDRNRAVRNMNRTKG
jgi:hypothetical protein